MSKAFQHFLYGFGSIIDIFSPVEQLKLSRGGFRGDQERLKNDSKKIKSDFIKVVNGKQKNTS